jgi:uncharacterized membrane protein YhaH (DUF805 family)
MGSFSIWHWIVVLIAGSVFAVPAALILRKAGYSAWWALLAFIPPLNVLALWFFALSPWPSLARAPRAGAT